MMISGRRPHLVLLLTALWGWFGTAELRADQPELVCSYGGNAFVTLVTGDDDFDGVDYQSRIRFELGADSTRLRMFERFVGVGETLSEATDATSARTLRLFPGRRHAEETAQYASTRRVHIESDFALTYWGRVWNEHPEAFIESDAPSQSPSPGRREFVIDTERLPAELGLVVPTRLVFEGERVVLIEEGPGPDNIVARREFAAYATLPSGARVPSLVYVTRFHGPERTPMRWRYEIEDLYELPSDRSLDDLELPPSYTVIDHVRGVSRSADGEHVYGELSTGPVQPATGQGFGAAPGQRRDVPVSMVVVGVGVLLVVGSIVVIKKRGSTA